MTDSPRRKSLILMSSILSIVGLAISLYSTFHHLELRAKGVTAAACNISADFNCDTVAASKYAEMFGVPLGVYGVGFFLGLLTLLGLALVKKEQQADALQAYGVSIGIGGVAAIALAAISFFALETGCPTCIGIYLVIIGLAVILFYYRKTIPGPWRFKHIANGGTYALLAVAASIAVFKFIRPMPADMTLDHPQGEHGAHDGHGHEQTDGFTILSKTQKDIKIDRSDYSGLGQDYRSGSDDAKVVIVEFADYECPACRGAYRDLKQVKQEYGDRIQIVFKNYPLDKSCNPAIQRRLHDFACKAAVYTRCAGRAGKFWEMHDLIFENQQQLNDSNLKQWAKSIGLSDSDIAECEKSSDIMAKIKADIEQGNELGINSTPTLYLNGYQVVGNRTVAALKAEIEKRLN